VGKRADCYARSTQTHSRLKQGVQRSVARELKLGDPRWNRETAAYQVMRLGVTSRKARYLKQRIDEDKKNSKGGPFRSRIDEKKREDHVDRQHQPTICPNVLLEEVRSRSPRTL